MLTVHLRGNVKINVVRAQVATLSAGVGGSVWARGNGRDRWVLCGRWRCLPRLHHRYAAGQRCAVKNSSCLFQESSIDPQPYIISVRLGKLNHYDLSETEKGARFWSVTAIFGDSTRLSSSCWPYIPLPSSPS